MYIYGLIYCYSFIWISKACWMLLWFVDNWLVRNYNTWRECWTGDIFSFQIKYSLQLYTLISCWCIIVNPLVAYFLAKRLLITTWVVWETQLSRLAQYRILGTDWSWSRLRVFPLHVGIRIMMLSCSYLGYSGDTVLFSYLQFETKGERKYRETIYKWNIIRNYLKVIWRWE